MLLSYYIGGAEDDEEEEETKDNKNRVSLAALKLALPEGRTACQHVPAYLRHSTEIHRKTILERSTSPRKRATEEVEAWVENRHGT